MIPSVCGGRSCTVWPDVESHNFTPPSADIDTTWSFGVHCIPQTASPWAGLGGLDASDIRRKTRCKDTHVRCSCVHVRIEGSNTVFSQFFQGSTRISPAISTELFLFLWVLCVGDDEREIGHDEDA